MSLFLFMIPRMRLDMYVHRNFIPHIFYFIIFVIATSCVNISLTVRSEFATRCSRDSVDITPSQGINTEHVSADQGFILLRETGRPTDVDRSYLSL
jgi:hypothetical protein